MALEEMFGCVEINDDTNYAAATEICVYRDADGGAVSDARCSDLRVSVFMRSRGPLFTAQAYKRASDRSWFPVELPRELGEVMAQTDKKLCELGFSLIQGAILESKTNYVTDLDGKPATYFERLFSEIA